MTIFEKIIDRQIPAKVIWEDEDAIAFHDVDPQAPVHVLIVPKKAVPVSRTRPMRTPHFSENSFWLRATWRKSWSYRVGIES